MRKLVYAISAFALTVATAAYADPIADRKALMKANGAAMGKLAPVAKGEKPYDAAEVMAALQTLADDAQKMDADKLFPAGSDKGDTTAAPTIWTDRAAFVAAIDKFKADTKKALDSKPADQAGVQAAVGMIGSNCASCHQTFRVKKS